MNSRDAELVAEEAWDNTKADEDPPYAACTKDHQLKLSNAVVDIDLHLDDPEYTTGIEGLADFEVEVRQILERQRAEEQARLLLEEGKEKRADAADDAAPKDAKGGKGDKDDEDDDNGKKGKKGK